jgi:hypothetical protein
MSKGGRISFFGEVGVAPPLTQTEQHHRRAARFAGCGIGAWETPQRLGSVSMPGERIKSKRHQEGDLILHFSHFSRRRRKVNVELTTPTLSAAMWVLLIWETPDLLDGVF